MTDSLSRSGPVPLESPDLPADSAKSMRDLEVRLTGVLSLAEDVGSSLTALRSRIDRVLSDGDEGNADYAHLILELERIERSVSNQNRRTGESVERLLDEIRGFSDEVRDLKNTFTGLEGQIGNVQEFSDEIRLIARETKIMALNALTEAARAGEAGSGFAVVAHDVNRLAVDSFEYSRKIHESTRGLLDGTQRVAAVVDNLFEGMKANATRLEEVADEGRRLDVVVKGIPQIVDAMEKRLSKDAILDEAGFDLEMASLAAASMQSRIQECVAYTESEAVREGACGTHAGALADQLLAALERHDRIAFVSAITGALDTGEEPLRLLHLVSTVVERVAKRQKREGVPITEIYLDARVLSSGMKELFSRIPAAERTSRGTVVIGNAFGDYHALGREMIVVFLRASGFRVVDLGLGVPSDRFVEAALEEGADVVGVSTLLLHTAPEVRKIRDGLHRAGLRDVPVLIGGAPFVIDEDLHRYYNVDAVARGVDDAIKIVSAACETRGDA